jgi:hypothetical protein
MQDQPQGQPFSESNLDSAEYRARLKRKLDCLIAVLEVAIAKVHQALAGPEPDVERLTRIQKNLQDTLAVCLRARCALDKRGQLPPGLSQDLSRVVNPTLSLKAPSELEGLGPHGELSSDERRDFDELARRLQS